MGRVIRAQKLVNESQRILIGFRIITVHNEYRRGIINLAVVAIIKGVSINSIWLHVNLIGEN